MRKEESFGANNDISVFDARIITEDRLGLESRKRDQRLKHKIKEPSEPPQVTNNTNRKQDKTRGMGRRNTREILGRHDRWAGQLKGIL